MTKKTEYLAFRASKDTVSKLRELQTNDDSLSSVIRNAIDFYYDYVQGILELLKEGDR